MKTSTLLLGTACSTLISYAAFAQSTGTATPIEGINKTTATSGTIAHAMAKKIPLKSTFSASHVSKSEIKAASPVATMDSLLNSEPSINATSAGPLGVESNVTFRSFNSAQFTQTYDGIAINDIFNAGATNGASVKNNVLITKQDIGGIDVYRGINNPATNGYFSLAGTINYNPVMPSDTRGGYITGSAGSFKTLKYNALFNTGKIDGVSDVIAFSHASSDGWLKHNHDINSNIYTAFNIDTGATGKIYGIFVYNLNHGEEAYDVPTDLIQKYGYDFQYPKSIYNEPLNDTDYLFILGTTQTIGSFTTVDLKGFFGADNFSRNAYSNPNYQKTGYYVPNRDPAMYEGPYFKGDTTYYGYYGRELGLQPSVTFDLPYNIVKIGGNYTIGHLHSSEYINNITSSYGNIGSGDPVNIKPGVNDLWDEHDTRTLYSLYAQDEIDLLNDKLKITPGVKYIYANTKDHDDVGSYYDVPGSLSQGEHYTSPTVGLSYEFLPGTVLYAAYGQNVQFPTIDAYYNSIAVGPNYNQIVPVNVVPEHVNDYEAGLRYANVPFGFHGALGFYLENFTNTFATYTDSTGVDHTTNAGASTHKGIELQMAEVFGEQHFDGMDVGDFTGYLNYSYSSAYFTKAFTMSSVGNNNASLATVNKGTPVAQVPQDILNIGGSWRLDGWEATVSTRYVTSEYIKQASVGSTSDLKEPAHFTLDLGVSKTIPVHFGIAKSLKFALNAENVLNRRYYAHAYAERYGSNSAPGAMYHAPAGASGSYASVQMAAPRAFYGSVTLAF